MNRLTFPDGLVRHAEPGAGNVDELHFFDTLVRDVDGFGQRKIPAGCTLFVRGWAYAPAPPRVAAGVLAVLDESAPIDAAYGRSRPDIALSFGRPELEPCGFQAIYPLAGLRPGPHTMRIVIRDESDGFYELPKVEAFEIVPSRALFRGIARTDDRMRIEIDGFTTLRSGAIPSGGTLLVERGDIVYLRGWAIDRENATALRGVFGIVDDDEYVMGVHGLPREDVARTVRLPDVVRCGFSLRISTRGLQPGAHALRVAALAPDETYAVSTVGTLEIT